MTKRSRTICLILAIILAVLLEVLTMSVMKYNAFFAIVSTVLYFATFLFAMIDGYCAFKGKFSEHHCFWLIRDIGLLGTQLSIYYIFGNMKNMEVFHIVTGIAVTVLFFCIAINFEKLGRKKCKYTCPE